MILIYFYVRRIMNKLLFFIIWGSSIFALNVNLGVSVSEAYKKSHGEKTWKDRVHGINLELTHKFKVSEIGLGISYEQKYEYQNREFGVVPLYALIKFNLIKAKTIPFVAFRYGRSYFIGEEKNSKDFYSLGLGFNFKSNYQVELSHDVKYLEGEKNCFGKNSITVRYNLNN